MKTLLINIIIYVLLYELIHNIKEIYSIKGISFCVNGYSKTSYYIVIKRKKLQVYLLIMSTLLRVHGNFIELTSQIILQ